MCPGTVLVGEQRALRLFARLLVKLYLLQEQEAKLAELAAALAPGRAILRGHNSTLNSFNTIRELNVTSFSCLNTFPQAI